MNGDFSLNKNRIDTYTPGKRERETDRVISHERSNRSQITQKIARTP